MKLVRNAPGKKYVVGFLHFKDMDLASSRRELTSCEIHFASLGHHLSCSVTLDNKGNPFLGLDHFSGAAAKKEEKGATEQLSHEDPANHPLGDQRI